MREPAVPVAAEHIEPEAGELDDNVDGEDRDGVVQDKVDKELSHWPLTQVVVEPISARGYIRHDGNYK